ncbi:MAG: DUF6285 domain-containing protein [Ilumatobacteraceae bacterium]
MTAPHDRPTAAELLEALHEWMERDLLPGVDGRLQFHTRVAINMVDIVRRELELGPDQEVRHEEVLVSFGMNDDAELAAAIRDGSFDSRLVEVLNRLRPVVEDKVRVANPRYLR